MKNHSVSHDDLSRWSHILGNVGAELEKALLDQSYRIGINTLADVNIVRSALNRAAASQDR